MERPRLATALATNAGATIGGSAYSANIIPIMPPTIDLSSSGLMAKNPTTTTASGRRRSSHGARLKNSHQITMAAAQASEPNKPITAASGLSTGTMKRSTSSRTAAATPGHSRSGFRDDGA